jgi:hypothetical protein
MKFTLIPRTMTPEIHCRARVANREIRSAVKAKVEDLVEVIMRGQRSKRLKIIGRYRNGTQLVGLAAKKRDGKPRYSYVWRIIIDQYLSQS